MTLRELREENEKSRAEVASVLGVSAQAVSHYENGLRRISLDHVLPLAKLYDCSAQEIIEAQLRTEKHD